jgi:hypothetical protein
MSGPYRPQSVPAPGACPRWCTADLCDDLADGTTIHTSAGIVIDLEPVAEGHASGAEVTIEASGAESAHVRLHVFPPDGDAPEVHLSPAEATALAKALVAAVKVIEAS